MTERLIFLAGLLFGVGIVLAFAPADSPVVPASTEPTPQPAARKARTPAQIAPPAASLPASVHCPELLDQARSLYAEAERRQAEFSRLSYRPIGWDEVGQSATTQERQIRETLDSQLAELSGTIETIDCEAYPCIATVEWEGDRTQLEALAWGLNDRFETRQTALEDNGLTTAAVAFFTSGYSPENLEGSVTVRMSHLLSDTEEQR